MTTGPTQSTPYIPDSSTQWKSAAINLNTYKSFSNVIINIVNVTDGGNQLYIDDISIGEILTGVEEESRINTFSIYPNPANSSATIEYFLNYPLEVSVVLYDLYGKMVEVLKQESQIEGKYSIPIRRNKISAGVYLVKFQFGNELMTRKLIFY